MIYHKYGAKRTEADGIKFASKKEAQFYNDLKLQVKAGGVLFFLMQVPFHLPGGIRYFLDFMVFESSGVVRCVDVKGFRTQTYKVKKKMVEALYPGVEIEEV